MALGFDKLAGIHNLAIDIVQIIYILLLTFELLILTFDFRIERLIVNFKIKSVKKM
jgi:hypothetical protein